jgi:hypothetical protein
LKRPRAFDAWLLLNVAGVMVVVDGICAAAVRSCSQGSVGRLVAKTYLREHDRGNDYINKMGVC